MRRPRLLDLYCGAGGAAMGYHRAGFDVVGVDVSSLLNYPFLLFSAHAIDFLCAYACSFDAIHASPPCQAHTTMNNRHRRRGTHVVDRYVSLIEKTRHWLDIFGKPYVIENVPGAKRILRDPILLHGGMFGLGVYRPRLFESNVLLVAPPRAPRPANAIGIYGQRPDGRRLWTRKDGSVQRAARSLEEGRAAMGIDWMTWDELTEAIPPSYTEHIGGQLIAALRAKPERATP